MAAFPRTTVLAVVLTACSLGAAQPAAVGTGAAAPPATSIERTPGAALYEVHLRTGPGGRTWAGSERITFTNTGSVTLDRIWLRLWSNGLDGCDPMAIRITDTSAGTWGDPIRRCTAVPVDLDAPLEPSAPTHLRFSLRIHVPARNDRFGYANGMSLLGTALPTLAVRDDVGWHLDPFVSFGESFYSLSGRYRVTLDVPKGLDTPTTGAAAGSRPVGDRVVRTYVAAHVRDFAWAAGHFHVLDAVAGGAHIRVWYRPALTPTWRATDMRRVARASMTTYARAFGAYPYPQVDVVLTAFKGYGGMEYPQIVFANAEEVAVSHELAHQWWYGIVGNDEYADPWLDESLATWSSYLPLDPWRRCASYDWPSPTARITNDMAYWSEHTKEYGTIYGGGGCMLANLAHRFGLERFEGILARYARRRWFGVARTEDLTAAIDHAAAIRLPALDMAAFWTRWRVG